MKLAYTGFLQARSRLLYNSGRVHFVTLGSRQGVCQYVAKVEDRMMYTVMGSLQRDGRIIGEACSCGSPNGGTCVHKGAVRCALENSDEVRRILAENEERVSSLSTQVPGAGYSYFDFDVITSQYDVTRRVYDEAYRAAMRRNDAVSIGLDYRPDVEGPYCVVRDSAKPRSVELSRDGILYMNCSHFDWGHRCFGEGGVLKNGRRQLCTDIVELLLRAQRAFELKQLVPDATSKLAMSLMEDMRGLDIPSNDLQTASRSVSLAPTVSMDDNRCGVEWRVGTDRLYAVPHPEELVQSVRSGGDFPQGKGEPLHFSRDRFEGTALELYHILEDCVDVRAAIGEQMAGLNGIPRMPQNVPLSGAQWDRLFDECRATGAYYRDRNEQRSSVVPLKLAERDVEITLTLSRMQSADGVFQGVQLHGEVPELIAGASYSYIIETGGTGAEMLRVGADCAQVVRSLRRYTNGRELLLTVGREHLSEFYYNVLPVLRKGVRIIEEDTDAIAEYLPPEPRFMLYLDCENGRPCGHMDIFYDMQCVSLFDWDDEYFRPEYFRSETLEKKALQLLTRFLPDKDPENRLFWCGTDPDEIYTLLDEGLRLFGESFEIACTNAFDALRIRKTPTVRVGVSVSGDLLDLEIGSDDLSREELLELLRSYRMKKKYHCLRSGAFVRLGSELEELAAMTESLKLSPKEFIKGKMHIPAYRALYLDKMLESCEGLYVNRNSRFKELIKGFKTVNESDYDAPAGLQGTLRNYQLYGYRWMRTIAACGFGGILADDMGLGKTVQMLAVLLGLKESGEQGTSLVVCPSSLVYNWMEECRKFAPGLRVAAVAGGKAEREECIARYREYDLLITSYDLLKRDVPLYEGCEFLVQVLDEAQYIKTHTTAAAKSVKVIRAKHRFALTGTPIENRLSELWSIFDYLMPGFLYNYETFRRDLETPIAKEKDEDARTKLQRMAAPFILRRLKGDVLKDLPEKLEETYSVPLEDEQRRIYDAQAVKITRMLLKQSGEQTNQDKLRILAELTRIRQICCDPSLLYEGYSAGSAKREACMDLIRTAVEGEHRILVFSQFTSMLELLAQDLREAGIEYDMLTGETDKRDRVELVHAFNEGTTPVFLISLKAGGTGLNLTGADTVIHYDPWWNIAAQNQATDRTHRIGQTKKVVVYKLIAKDTIEEKIQKLQQTKSELAEGILGGETGGIASMSTEELLALLS